MAHTQHSRCPFSPRINRETIQANRVGKSGVEEYD
jgi:hypothetical protein